ncbi:MAG: helix-turn-helix domain-containing protein [Ruminococcaceae bacterium]|nr:helix-turn-helix domain-containing protein [Oscillospiraceae bacterium]
MPEIEIMTDEMYLEPNTVRITVHNSQHHGKVWQHTHGFFEFVYVEKGFSLHSYNGKTSVLTGGDLFAIFPGDIHSYNSAYHTSIFNVLFYLEDLPGIREEILRLPGIDWNRDRRRDQLPIIRVGLQERQELVDLLMRMIDERKQKKTGWELNLKGLLISFLIFYSRLISNAEEGADTKNGSDHRGYCGYIYKVLQFVEDRYRDDICADDMAEAAGLSADYLAKQFKSVMSMTPVEYVRKFRVAKAMELLKNTDLSIAAIADAVGFGDLSLFSRVFKQNIGVSPAVFRKE